MSDATILISMLAIGLTGLLSIIAWAFHTGGTHNAVRSLEFRMDRMETKIDKIVDKLID